MFRSLRNRLIAVTMVVTAIVLIVAFSVIYAVVHGAAEKRPYYVETTVNLNNDQTVLQTIRRQVQAERQQASSSLLIALLVAGISIEVVAAVLAYFLAETAIAPVQEAYDAQKTFIANASHEIKTPLAAISANLEAAEIVDNPWIDNVAYEVRALTALNQELLALSRADQVFNEYRSASGETFELLPTIDEVVAPFAPRLEQGNISYQLRTRLKNPKANLAKADFVQILTILFDNAVKYCDKDITITLKSHALNVRNDGATISEDDLPHIFERFYQTDKSSEGVGLGLAIAESLAKKNHWKLSASSNKQGTTFTLEY